MEYKKEMQESESDDILMGINSRINDIQLELIRSDANLDKFDYNEYPNEVDCDLLLIPNVGTALYLEDTTIKLIKGGRTHIAQYLEVEEDIVYSIQVTDIGQIVTQEEIYKNSIIESNEFKTKIIGMLNSKLESKLYHQIFN